MEVVLDALGRQELVLAGIDDLLESRLCSCIVFLPQQCLSLDGVGKTLGHLIGSVLVLRAYTFVYEGQGCVTVTHDEIQDSLLRLGIRRLVTCAEDMVHDRRGPPAYGKLQI